MTDDTAPPDEGREAFLRTFDRIAEALDRGTAIATAEQAARDTGVPNRFRDPEQLCSPSVTELYGALSKAQRDLVNPGKERTGQTGQQHYQYATLAQVLDAIRVPFADNGLGVIQRVDHLDGGVVVETTLSHESGEWIRDPGLFIPAAGADAKAIGSAITYGRRYALTTMVGLIGADEDDDGTRATESVAGGAAAAPRARQTRSRAAAEPKASDAETFVWRWGQEKSKKLGEVSEKSLQWLIGQEKFGKPEDRAIAQAELDRRAAATVPPAGDAAPAAEPEPTVPEEPVPAPKAPITKATGDTLVDLLVQVGKCADEQAAHQLIAEAGDGEEWAVRQIGIIRQRFSEQQADDDAAAQQAELDQAAAAAADGDA